MSFFFSIEVGFSIFGLMVHTSYGVDTLYSLFSAIWRRFKHEIHNEYDTLLSPRNALRWGYSNAAVVPCVRVCVRLSVRPSVDLVNTIATKPLHISLSNLADMLTMMRG